METYAQLFGSQSDFFFVNDWVSDSASITRLHSLHPKP